MSFDAQQVFNFNEAQFIFSFVACDFGVLTKNSLLPHDSYVREAGRINVPQKN